MKSSNPIKPGHYKQGRLDLFDAWYATLPFQHYKTVMVCIAERYMKREKDDPVQDIDKAIETLKRLRSNMVKEETYDD